MAAAAAKDGVAAEAADSRLAALHRDLFCEANPIPVKWALAKMEKTSGGIRSPLAPLGLDFHGRVEAALQQANCIESAGQVANTFGWPAREMLLQGHLFDQGLINQARARDHREARRRLRDRLVHGHAQRPDERVQLPPHLERQAQGLRRRRQHARRHHRPLELARRGPRERRGRPHHHARGRRCVAVGQGSASDRTRASPRLWGPGCGKPCGVWFSGLDAKVPPLLFTPPPRRVIGRADLRATSGRPGAARHLGMACSCRDGKLDGRWACTCHDTPCTADATVAAQPPTTPAAELLSKLHACANCKRSKVSCSRKFDQGPCTRCARLQVSRSAP
eukprot:scaffold124388_cov63-Phaeocystis_antarctica.AAC.1